MDRLEAMSLLVAAVETGSFSAASRKLGVPLPTVSRKVGELEAHLQVRLLIRSTRRLTLTEAGVAYLARCRRILDDVHEAERLAADEYHTPRGDLFITAPVLFGRLHLLPIITRFLAAYPEIRVQLVLADHRLRLADDRIDIALRIGALPDSRLVATPVGSVRRVVCASPDYLARHGAPKSPADLSAHDCISFDDGISGSSWAFDWRDAGKDLAGSLQPRLTVNTIEAAIDAAIAGVGLTRALSYQVADAIEQGRLQPVLGRFEPDPVPVHLVLAGPRPVPLKIRAFIDLAVPLLREVLLAHDRELRRATTPKRRRVQRPS